MDTFAVAIMPIARLVDWNTFADEIDTGGSRAEAHREFLRRGGVTREHVFVQQTPMGNLMVLVWEGVNQQQQADLFASTLQNPQSDHERYLRDHIIPVVHGIDVSQPPPPPAEKKQVNEV